MRGKPAGGNCSENLKKKTDDLVDFILKWTMNKYYVRYESVYCAHMVQCHSPVNNELLFNFHER